jgi:hypothetical protein
MFKKKNQSIYEGGNDLNRSYSDYENNENEINDNRNKISSDKDIDDAFELYKDKYEHLLIDQLRNLSDNQRTKLVRLEQSTGWPRIFSFNNLLHYANLSLFFGSLWMVVVAANLDLTIILFSFLLFFSVLYFSHSLLSLINDRS